MRHQLLKVLALTIYFVIATLVIIALAYSIHDHTVPLLVGAIISCIYLVPCGLILIVSLSEEKGENDERQDT